MAKYALLVGISEYQDPEISDLPFAARDAEALGVSLEKDCGFDDVRVLSTDSDSGEAIGSGVISRELIDLRSQMGEEDTFLFFFAGHGRYRDGQSVLLPADARWAMPALSDLQVSALVGEMNNLKCSQRALVFDCCRNDPEASRGQGDNRLSDDFTRDIKAAAQSGSGRASSTCLLFSCSRGERAYEWSGKRHGAYTYYFLEALKEKAWSGGRLTLQDVAGYLEEEVPGWAEKNGHTQLPWSEMYGSLRPIVLGERQGEEGLEAAQGESQEKIQPASSPPGENRPGLPPAGKLCEGLFLFDADLAAKDWPGLENHVGDLLKKNEAELVYSERWPDRKLSYEVKGCRKGTYFLTYFYITGNPGISGLHRDVQLSERILRLMVLQNEYIEEVLEQHKERRAEREAAQEEEGA